MSLVAGEDSESDEEINTDQLMAVSSVPRERTGIVTGEDDEEDEEDSSTKVTGQTENVSGSMDSLDVKVTSKTKKQQWDPPSLLHKKLGEFNLNLRKNIVDRILKLYHMTSHSLTVVNDNLSRAQGVIEKVNANVKKSDQDLAQLKASLDDIFDTAQSLAPTLRMDLSRGTLEKTTPTK